ncbi:hypothetical protein NFI96_031241, partial [Prochilodus magdalenae]
QEELLGAGAGGAVLKHNAGAALGDGAGGAVMKHNAGAAVGAGVGGAVLTHSAGAVVGAGAGGAVLKDSTGAVLGAGAGGAVLKHNTAAALGVGKGGAVLKHGAGEALGAGAGGAVLKDTTGAALGDGAGGAVLKHSAGAALKVFCTVHISTGGQNSGETSAQTIDPLVGEVQLPEGDHLTLSCNYSSTSTNDPLQWYRQSPGSSPEFLLFIYPRGGLRAEDLITPNRDAVFTGEGQTVTLSCNYSGTADSLHWYRQYSGSPPQFLILDYSGTITEAQPRVPGISISHVEKQKTVDLKISSAAVSDSVLYYCALQPTVTGNPDTLYRNWFYV